MFNFIQLHPCPGRETNACCLFGNVIYVVLFRTDGTVFCEAY